MAGDICTRIGLGGTLIAIGIAVSRLSREASALRPASCPAQSRPGQISGGAQVESPAFALQRGEVFTC